LNAKELKWLERLNEIIRDDVGFQCKWTSLQHLHDYIAKCGRGKAKDFHGIPISFALKYTAVPDAPKAEIITEEIFK